MKLIFAEFSALLKTRLNHLVFTSEDSVRYTFFAALLHTTKIAPHEIILEFPHPSIPGAQIDTYVPSTPDRKGLVIEFKYDRQPPGGRNMPRTQNAGEVFNDLYRLARFEEDPSADRLLVYLTDAGMAGYLSNSRNQLTDFFQLAPGHQLRVDERYLETKAITFQRCIGGSLNADLTGLWQDTLPNNHHLRICQITPISQTGN
ncbi:hypothetical protein ACFLXQ_03670 [Chloroflexota bacterium]